MSTSDKVISNPLSSWTGPSPYGHVGQLPEAVTATRTLQTDVQPPALTAAHTSRTHVPSPATAAEHTLRTGVQPPAVIAAQTSRADVQPSAVTAVHTSWGGAQLTGGPYTESMWAHLRPAAAVVQMDQIQAEPAEGPYITNPVDDMFGLPLPSNNPAFSEGFMSGNGYQVS